MSRIDEVLERVTPHEDSNQEDFNIWWWITLSEDERNSTSETLEFIANRNEEEIPLDIKESIKGDILLAKTILELIAAAAMAEEISQYDGSEFDASQLSQE